RRACAPGWSCRRRSAPRPRCGGTDRLWSIDPFGDLIAAACEQRRHFAVARDGGLRRDFGERLQHEGALVHARVRYGEARRGDDCIAVEQQVEVERARGVGKRTLPAVLLLNRLEIFKQLLSRQPRIDFHDLIEKLRLVEITDGGSPVQARYGGEAGAGQGFEFL